MKEVCRSVRIILHVIEGSVPMDQLRLLNTLTAENIFIRLATAVTRCVDVPVLQVICDLMHQFALIVKEPTGEMIEVCLQLHEKNHEEIKKVANKALDILIGLAAA